MLAMLAALALTPVVQSASAAPRGGDSTPPSTPGPLVVTAATQTSITLTWLPATDDVAVVEYGVLWNTRRPKDVEPVPIPPHDSVLKFTKTGLRCGTSYAVKVLAFDAAENYSEKASEATVSTAACVDSSGPTTPSGVTQIANTQTTATLAWKPSTDDVGVAGYAVSTGGVLAGTTAGTSYTVAGLTCGSWFSAVVQAYDAAGNRSSGAAFTGSTAACADRTAPKPPSGLSQMSATTTSMSIAWSSSSGAARYGVYVGPSRVTETSATGATVSALACGTTYSIGVDAVDAAGNRSAPSTVQMATAPCPTQPGHRTSNDTTPPTTPAAVTVTSASQASVAIRWASSSDNVGVVGYSISKNGAPAGDTTGTTFLVTSLACGSGVTIGVVARDAAGNRSQPATAAATTAPCVDGGAPTMPGAVTMQNRTETSITFSWALSTDAVGVAGYGIYVDGKLVDTTTQGQYTVSGLACGGIYTIGVDAFDAEGNRSASSTTLLATTPCSDVAPPSAPTGLEVSNPTRTSVDVAWLASKDDVGVAGYDLYVDDTLVRTTAELAATLDGLDCDTTVVVGVEAFDAAGNRSDRATAQADAASCDQVFGSLFVSPSGSDSSSCIKSAPCATFGRAYKAARPGQVIEVASGAYPYQQIALDEAKSSTDRVLFRPSAGATVTVAQLDFGQRQDGIPTPRHVEVDDMRIGYTRVWPGGEDIVIRNITGTWFDVFGGESIAVIGGAYGPCQAPAQGACTPRLIGTNQTVDGATIYGMTSTDLANYHVDGIFVRGCQSCRISRSKFSGNMIANIRLQNCCSLEPNRDITIENNWFAAPLQGDGRSTRTTAIDIDNPISNLLIRNNSFAENAGVTFADASYEGTNTRIANNLILNNTRCAAGIAYISNLYRPFSATNGVTPCSSTDRLVPTFGYVSGSDFHLTALSLAIDAANSSTCPATDIDGDARSSSCDVGADER